MYQSCLFIPLCIITNPRFPRMGFAICNYPSAIMFLFGFGVMIPSFAVKTRPWRHETRVARHWLSVRRLDAWSHAPEWGDMKRSRDCRKCHSLSALTNDISVCPAIWWVLLSKASHAAGESLSFLWFIHASALLITSYWYVFWLDFACRATQCEYVLQRRAPPCMHRRTISSHQLSLR